MDLNALDNRLVQIVPHPRQVEMQEMEFYAFDHFSVNTFTGKSWGSGQEDESVFDPRELDADQWADAMKSAGMTGIIITAKHHDGFCIWPSKLTNHTVARSPFRNGHGDVLREVSDACRRAGLKFGVYLSPWDRNCRLYGRGREYDDFFVGQLTELLTQYGEICSVWFDGACGEGENGKKQYYDWQRYYKVIRELQPNACIHISGPDIRWCGNEKGVTRDSEWSVVPERMRETEKIKEWSQRSEQDAEFFMRKLSAKDQDLGSRKVLENEPSLVWYPAEVNVSIRPEWFYRDRDDPFIRSVENLEDLYNRSVGGNATFLLNIPTDKRGLFHEYDVARLKEFGAHMRRIYAKNLLEGAKIESDVCESGHEIENVREDSYKEYFKTSDYVRRASITITFPQPEKISRVVMKENIFMSQRIESFRIETGDGRVLYDGTVVGHKKIAAFPETVTDTLRIHITDSRVCPTLSYIGIY